MGTGMGRTVFPHDIFADGLICRHAAPAGIGVVWEV
jgi:hypothetical protein